MQHLTKGISIIFHPVFVPMYAFLMYLQIDHYSVATLHNLTGQGFWIIFSAVFMFTCLMPVLGINMMKNAGIVSSWEVTEKKERVPVLITCSVFLGLLYYIFSYIESISGNIFDSFFSVIMGGIVLGLLGALISNFWKISLHAMMISALAGALIGLCATLSPVYNMEDMVFYNSIILLIVGIVGFSRLYQNAHNLPQVIAGTVLGFTVEFLVVNNEWYF